MHLNIGGDNILERIGLWTGLVPTPLVHVTFGAGYAHTLVAATRLGVLEALGEEALTVAQLADRTKCSPEGVRALCSALVGFDVLERQAGRYRNTRRTRRWLLSSSKQSLVDAVLFLGYCINMLAGLEDGIRTGNIQRLHDQQHPPAFWSAYMRALAAFARVVRPEFVRRVRLPEGASRLLDVGGGHGLYSAYLAQQNPLLHAEILDLPGACAVGRQILDEVGLSERVIHREGDFREDDWGEGYDVILIFNVFHNATEAEAARLCRQAAAALRPGGVLVIKDATHDGGNGNISASAGYNELFFYLISGAQAWPCERIQGWMEDAGFVDVSSRKMLTAPEVCLQGRLAECVSGPVPTSPTD